MIEKQNIMLKINVISFPIYKLYIYIYIYIYIYLYIYILYIYIYIYIYCIKSFQHSSGIRLACCFILKLKIAQFYCSRSSSFVATTRFYLLSLVICCHSLSLVAIRCHPFYHSLSLVVTRCHAMYQSSYKRSVYGKKQNIRCQ